MFAAQSYDINVNVSYAANARRTGLKNNLIQVMNSSLTADTLVLRNILSSSYKFTSQRDGL